MRYSDEETQGPVIRDRRRIDPVTGMVRNPAESRPAEADGGQRPSGPRAAASRPDGVPQPEGNGPGGDGPGGDAAGDGPGGPFPGGAFPAGGFGSSFFPADAPAGGEPADGGADGADTAAMLAERTADLQRLQAEYSNYRKRVDRDRLAVKDQALAAVLGQLLPVLDDIGRARDHGELVGGFRQVAESLEAACAKLGLITYGEPGDPFDPTVHEALMHSYSAEVTEPTCVQLLQPGYRVGDRILRPARVGVAESAAGADDSAPAADTGGPGEPGEPGAAGSAG